MRRTLLFAAWAFLSLAAQGQVVELSGGTSTLYQSQGATLSLHASSFEGGLSAGTADGHFLVGTYLRRVTPSATYTLGMQNLNLSLPTDLFTGEHHLTAIGAGIEATRGSNRIQAFAGATSTHLDSPYVQGFTNLAPAAAVVIEHTLTQHCKLSTQILSASNLSLFQSVDWKPAHSIQLAATAGVAGSAHYAAGSLSVRRPLFDLDAEYIHASSTFQRIGAQADQSPEFINENISATIRSSPNPSFVLTLSRQNFLIPGTVDELPDNVDIIPPEDTLASISTLDQAAAVQQIRALRITGSLFHSTSQGLSNLAYAVSASLPITHRIEIQASFYGNRLLDLPVAPSTSLVTTVREKLSSRLSLSETINRSGGQTSLGMGGSLLSSLGSLSVDYQTVYVASRPLNPFQQTLLLDVQLTLFGRLLLHAGTLVSPTGKLLYTVDARAIQGISRNFTTAQPHTNLGSCLLRVHVVNSSGDPIEGAALEIAGKLSFTDSDGNLFLRDRRPTLHPFRVALEEFLDGRTYRIVSQPMSLASTRTVQTPASIVVDLAAP